MGTDARLHYVDWLRIAAFAILILYHSAVAFFPAMDWLISSSERSAGLQMLMDHPRAWRLALLFFISGMGTWFALRSRGLNTFLAERAKRLVIPLAFAMAVIVVPQVWYERVWSDGYAGSLWTFWVERYFTEGKYPTGNITWAHMWFVAYLFAMSVGTGVLMALLGQRWMRRIDDLFCAIASSSAVYTLFLAPFVLNWLLTPFFPRQTNALYNDGAWFVVWASWFVLGLLAARNHAAIIGGLVARRRVALTMALLLSGILYETAWNGTGASVLGGWSDMTALYKMAVFALAWAMILTLVGYGALYLNRPSAALAWLSPKIFPLYIAHQTVIVAALFYVLPLEIGLLAKYLAVASLTLVLSLGFAIAADRLPWPLRALCGLGDDGRRLRAPLPTRPQRIPR